LNFKFAGTTYVTVLATLPKLDREHGFLPPLDEPPRVHSLANNVRENMARIHVLATGPMPRRISFKMDGNRWYARKLGRDGKGGHPMGLENMG